MKYMNKSIEELHEMLKNGEVTSKELIEMINEIQDELYVMCAAFIALTCAFNKDE